MEQQQPKDPEPLNADCKAFLTHVENTLLQASTRDRERIVTCLSKSLEQWLHNEAEAIDVDMESFEISEASVSAVDGNPWPDNPFVVNVYPRKKYSGRIGMYIPAKLQRAHDKRHYLYLKLDAKGQGPCRAENANLLKFAQEYMDKFWKRSKFRTINAIKSWLWDVWHKGDTHETCVALVKSYKRHYAQVSNPAKKKKI